VEQQEFPDDIRGLVEDLEHIGFKVATASDHPWPGGPRLELRRSGVRGIRSVQMSVDRAMWEVTVKIGRRWYEPFWALRVLDGQANQSRALSHAERRRYTVEAVRRIRGTRAERRELRRQQLSHRQAYTKWAMGEGPKP
jgi:hypothetical protein